MTAAEFVAKWSRAALSERSSSQQHFLDLCELVGHPKPAEIDPTGDSFCFERGTEKHGGGDGWADVWKRGSFAFEYKGRHANLAKAFDQLLRYRASLDNPPLLVVCDTDTIEIRTNFTGTPEAVYQFTTLEIGQPRNLEILHALFHDPVRLRPGRSSEAITREAAAALASLAGSLRTRGQDAEASARFLDRIVFCLFAEDVGLLPDGIFGNILENTLTDPERFARYASELFRAMADGGEFQFKPIAHFNGGLFSDPVVPPLESSEIAAIHVAAQLDWGAVDPSIFGTLFQRGLDPSTRAALGAEYTGRADIEDLVEPVLIAPLRREWEAIQSTIRNLLATGKKNPKSGVTHKAPTGPALRKALAEASSIKHAFLHRLARIHVLDPACGSGNFLYIALQKLKDLEKEVILFGGSEGVETSFFPTVGPWQFHGIEINPYAHELAQLTLWIGYLQWHRGNGYPVKDSPLLKKLDNFHLMDALLDLSDPANPKEAEWPVFRADREVVVIGNPPFLGDKIMRRELGDKYVESLRRVFAGRIPGQSDLCCYWFEKARAYIEKGMLDRAGLLATQGIRGGANREVLKRIKESGSIYFAVSDRNWILDGANVHISMVGFCGKSGMGMLPLGENLDANHGQDAHATSVLLDGKLVSEINANLSADANTGNAPTVLNNVHVGFLGSCKGGPFDISQNEAVQLLNSGGNPHGLPNSDVMKPVVNSSDLLGRNPPRWIIDNANLSLSSACLYERPHELVIKRVKPSRDSNRNPWLKENWWRPQRMRPEMRNSIHPLDRFLVTPTTAKHRIFLWLNHPILPDHQLIVFARSDDFFFGVLHSRFHETWSLAQGTQLREKESGFRYTPTTCFETFPFPWDHRLPVTALTPEQQTHHAKISEAARALVELRTRWLNPPEWTREDVLEFPASETGAWSHLRDPQTGLARYVRTVPRDPGCAKHLADRTLTKLYNARPAWLAAAHATLDAAVAAAYGWPADLPEKDILASLLERTS